MIILNKIYEKSFCKYLQVSKKVRNFATAFEKEAGSLKDFR